MQYVSTYFNVLIKAIFYSNLLLEFAVYFGPCVNCSIEDNTTSGDGVINAELSRIL